MRNHNKAFCQLIAEIFEPPGPVVEFGAYQVEGQEGFADLRSLFADREYLGCDMRPGPGVDRVEDVTAIGMPTCSAGTIICLETFEHVFEIKRAFEEVQRVLKPGGIFIITAPFYFKIHGYPDDYWRMTPSCLRQMLKGYGLRVVGQQGAPKTPHTVMGLGVKEPVPIEAEAKARRLIEGYHEWCNAAGASMPIGTKLKRQFGMLFRSKAERAQIRDEFAASFQIDHADAPVLSKVG